LILADDSEINVLNQVGSRVFALSDGRHSVGQIVASITDEFAVEFDQARADVIEFLQQMVDRNVIVLGDEQE
jgi:hypothetical protein